MEINDLQVGRIIYLASQVSYEKSGEYVVSNIARKYATVSDVDHETFTKRVSLETMTVVDKSTGTVLYKVYKSKKDYDDWLDLSVDWKNFYRSLPFNTPSWITHEKLAKLRNIISE